MALTAVLRKFRIPAAVLILSLLVGLFFLAPSDAGAYHNPVPARPVEYQVNGDPDLPAGFTEGHQGQVSSDSVVTLWVILKAALVWEILGV